MKFVVLLCLLAQCYAARDDNKKEEGKTEKRALVDGNDGIRMRNTFYQNSTPLPSSSPGIVYAETKHQQSDKSPTREVYATPVPQVAKFSDVLTGHGASFPTAIEGHLYSPVQVYQPRLGSPTTYEVSPPIPAQLAYTETKTYQAPIQNSIQFEPHKQKQFARVTVNYTPYQQLQQQQPQPFIHPQQFIQQFNPQQFNPEQFAQNSQPQFIQTNPNPTQYQQPIYQQQQPKFLIRIPYPHPPQLNNQPIQYQQAPVQYSNFPVQFTQQQVPFTHQSLSLIQPMLQGITYAEQHHRAPIQHPFQREVKTAQPALKVTEKSTVQPNTEKHGAVSYASFSQSQPNYIQPAATVTPISVAPSTVTAKQTKSETASQTVAPFLAPQPQLSPYFRPQYIPQSISQSAFFPQQVYNQESQSSNFAHPPVAISPTFPPVQYFGKFASQIFGTYPH